MSETMLDDETNLTTAADVPAADAHATVAITGGNGRESPTPSNGRPSNACEDAIRALAHQKWEEAGRPAGDGVDFWLEAEREVGAERAGRAQEGKS